MSKKLGKRIGEKIIHYRNKMNITQEKLAYENGFSKGYLSDIEAGKKIPSIEMLDKIAKALEIDIKDLF